MFDFVRHHNRLMQIGLGLVLMPLFAASGVQGYTHFFSEGAQSIASVDGRAITRTEWDARRRQDIERLRQQNPSIDLALLDTPEARLASLNGIVRDRVLQAVVEHQALTPSDERVAMSLRMSPQYADLRDPAKRAAFLAQRGMTADAFFEAVKEQLAQSQVFSGVAASEQLPAITLDQSVGAWFDQRELRWQRFDPKDYAASSQPTEAQIQAYYNDRSHAAEFTSPEQARIDYVVFDVDALKPQMSINPADVRAYYDNNQSHYSVPEERRASHILVSLAAKAPEADVARARARAESLLAALRRNPGSFAEVARKESDDVGTREQGGDLDFLSRKDAPAGGFAEALFKLKPGEISEPVRSPAGFHIIQLVAVRGGAVRPFEEVRGQIEDQLRTQLAQKAFADKADAFTNQVYEQADALPVSVDGYKLTPRSAVVQRQPQPGAAGPLASARLLADVFGPDALKSKHNTEAVETGSGQLTAAHVIEYRPSRLRPLAELHDEIADRLRRTQAAAAAKKEGEARVAAARKDASLVLPLSATVGRSAHDPQVPQSVVQAALKADLTHGPAVVGVALEDGGYAALRVLRNVPTVPPQGEASGFQQSVSQAYAEAEQQALFEALKTRYKADVDEKRVAKLQDSAASGAE